MKISWRLKEQPTSESLRELVKDGILTKEEAREILFSLQDTDERSIDGFKLEIKFLRELIDKLVSDRTKVVEIIREREPYWKRYEWYQPYYAWSSNSNQLLCGTDYTVTTTNQAGMTQAGMTQAGITNATTNAFSSIETF